MGTGIIYFLATNDCSQAVSGTRLDDTLVEIIGILQLKGHICVWYMKLHFIHYISLQIIEINN